MASENAEGSAFLLQRIHWTILRMVIHGDFYRFPVSNRYNVGMTRLTSGPPARSTTTCTTPQQVTTLRLYGPNQPELDAEFLLTR